MSKKSDYLIVLLFIAGGVFLYMNNKKAGPTSGSTVTASGTCSDQPLTLSPEVKAYIDSLFKGSNTPAQTYKLEELNLHLSNLEKKVGAIDTLKENRQKSQQQITELRNKLQQQKQQKIKTREDLRNEEFQILRRRMIAACRAEVLQGKGGGGNASGGLGGMRPGGGGGAGGLGGMRPGMRPMPADDGESVE